MTEVLKPLSKEEKAKILTLQKFRRDNLIYYFKPGGTMYPNPFQSAILKAWKDETKKVFVGSGANRKGKTTIGVIIGYSVMFGEWPWSGEKIPFPHDDPRLVLYVGKVGKPTFKRLSSPNL